MSGPHGQEARFRVAARVEEGAGFPELEAVLAGIADHLDYEDQGDDNATRARWAGVYALIPYASRMGTYRSESVATALGDLISDLRHLADLCGVDWDILSDTRHYRHEVTEED